MDIGSIDRSATGNLGWLHRVSPTAKLTAFALVLGAVVVTWNVFVALALLVLLAATAASASISLKLACSLAAYPAFFAVIFALASAPNALTGTLIVLKALSAGLAAVIIVLTTPYPHVFAPLQRIVPGIVGDALLMTYRTTFLLLAKFAQLVRAIRLRTGLRGQHPARAARATTAALGSLLLYALDLAQRDYDVMRLRGYSGRLRIQPPRSHSRARDAITMAVAAVLLVLSATWRLGHRTLNPYSWLVPLPALLLLGIATTARMTRKEKR